MKKLIAMLVLFLLITPAVLGSAKQDWLDAKQVSREKQAEHREAKIKFQADKSEENRQIVVDTGKEVLHAALDEAELWLEWKREEAEENDEVPSDLRDQILSDIDTNLDKVDALRSDVDGVTNQLELGMVFLKMIGKYGELLTDVARDSGKVWVYVAEQRLGDAEEIEEKLRDVATSDFVISKLDDAKKDLEEAKENIEKADNSYDQVKTPGTPLIKFSEGNNYLRVARTNLLSAGTKLREAYRMIGEQE